MNNKFNKNELLEMIDLRLTKLTEEEILELITEELNKENAQIDMDYIDICYDLLEVKRNASVHSEKTEKHKIKKPVKVLLIAAVFAAVVVSTVTASAQLKLNIPQKIAQLIDGNAEFDYNLENADNTADGYALLDTDLAKRLEDYGITPVTFPEEMIKDHCKITEIKVITNDDILKDVEIEFEYYGKEGNMSIEQLSDSIESTGVGIIMDVEAGEMIKVNGLDILIFEQKDICLIRYKNNLTNYQIHLNCNLETAIKFAESIK